MQAAYSTPEWKGEKWLFSVKVWSQVASNCGWQIGWPPLWEKGAAKPTNQPTNQPCLRVTPYSLTFSIYSGYPLCHTLGEKSQK